MSISIECPVCRSLNSISNTACSKCEKRIPPLNRKYWIRYKVHGQSKKECLGIVSFKEAKEREVQLLAAIPHKTTGSSPFWGDITDKYVAKLIAEERSKNYIADTKRYLDKFREHIGNKSLESITATDVREFKTSLRASKLSEATCDRNLQAGKAAWNYAVEDIRNPFTKVKLFNPENVTERFLTEDQRMTLLREAQLISRKFYEIMVVTMNTGFRKNEVLRLKRSQVNFETGIISIRQKRNLQHTTFLNDACREILSNIPDNGTEYFWVSHKTNQPYRNDWRSAWDKARKRAGLPDEFRWHDLRHDVGTAIYAATHDLQAVQRFLGHRQIKTTQRYAHTQAEYLREISQKISVGNHECPIGVPVVRKRKKVDKMQD